MRARVVPELGDERVLIERPLDQGTLHSLTSPVNQPNFDKASLVRGTHVLLNDVHHITRREGVQVQRISYR